MSYADGVATAMRGHIIPPSQAEEVSRSARASFILTAARTDSLAALVVRTVVGRHIETGKRFGKPAVFYAAAFHD